MYFLELMNTPVSPNIPSPAQIPYNRRLRTIIPISEKLLRTEIQSKKKIKQELEKRQERMKKHLDKRCSRVEKIGRSGRKNQGKEFQQ